MLYVEWSPVLESSDTPSSISPIMIGEIETTSLLSSKSAITIDDLELFCNLSFTHHIRILNGEKDIVKRWKYIKLSLDNKWDSRYLQQQIKDNVADKYGAMPSNFSVTIRDSRDAIKVLNMFKDEYLLDFINTEEIGIRDFADIDERVVEKEIIHNIKKFIMTFGRDFAFVGNQYHLEAFSEDFFPTYCFLTES